VPRQDTVSGLIGFVAVLFLSNFFIGVISTNGVMPGETLASEHRNPVI
jgi:hypothetical protein